MREATLTKALTVASACCPISRKVLLSDPLTRSRRFRDSFSSFILPIGKLEN